LLLDHTHCVLLLTVAIGYTFSIRKASSLTQKGLKNVFDEAIKTVLAPADRSGTTGRRKKKNCVIL
jgi:hypothetical protein